MLKVLVITGDHTVPDPEKVGSRYNEEGLKAHRIMQEAFADLANVECTVLADHAELLDLVRTQHFGLGIRCQAGNHGRAGLDYPALPQRILDTACRRAGLSVT